MSILRCDVVYANVSGDFMGSTAQVVWPRVARVYRYSAVIYSSAINSIYVLYYVGNSFHFVSTIFGRSMNIFIEFIKMTVAPIWDSKTKDHFHTPNFCWMESDFRHDFKRINSSRRKASIFPHNHNMHSISIFKLIHNY